ncbi:hypothetical protein N9M65_01905 [Luminiphilus sp.]|nr:hypothetical protein [Luminiphilus sp.]
MTFFFVTLWIVFPFFWISLMKLFRISILQVSIPSVLLLSIFLFQYIGFPILFFELDEYRAQTINDQAVIWLAFIVSSSVITLLVFGFLMGKIIFGPLNSSKVRRPNSGSMGYANMVIKIAILGFLSLGAIALWTYLQKVGLHNVPVLQIASVEDVSVGRNAVLRSEMGNNFGGKYHWYRLFMRDFLQIGCLAVFAYYLATKKYMWLLGSILTIFLSGFSMLMAAEKSPILWFAVSLVMVFLIQRRNADIPVRWVLIGVPLGLIAVAALYLAFRGSPSVAVAIQNGLSRVLMGQMAGIYHYLLIFPNKLPFLWGASFPNPGGVFPWEPFRLTVEVMHLVRPELAARGLVGSMPTFFWGELYANFGFFTAIVVPFFLGLSLYFLNSLFLRLPQSALTIGVYVWVILHYRKLSNTGLGKFVVDTELWIICLALLLVLVTARQVLPANLTRDSGG